MAGGGKLAWLIGLIFGSFFGVLFAPRKGKELRDKIKADRKKGKLGFAPLQDDMKRFGSELLDFAREFYQSQAIQDVVEKGRARLKDISDEFVDEVADFHVSRIVPFEKSAKKALKKKFGSKKRKKHGEQ